MALYKETVVEVLVLWVGGVAAADAPHEGEGCRRSNKTVGAVVVDRGGCGASNSDVGGVDDTALEWDENEFVVGGAASSVAAAKVAEVEGGP